MAKLFLILFGVFFLLTGCNKWEYKTIVVVNESHERTEVNTRKSSAISAINPDLNELQKLGDEGWELVTSYIMIETPRSGSGNEKMVPGSSANVWPQRVIFVLKKRKLSLYSFIKM